MSQTRDSKKDTWVYGYYVVAYGRAKMNSVYVPDLTLDDTAELIAVSLGTADARSNLDLVTKNALLAKIQELLV